MSYSISFAGYNQRRRITRSVINWFINHQGIDRFNIFIDIIDRRCRNTDGCNGTCTTTGDLARPRWFEIEMDNTQDDEEYVSTLLHEMTHVEQRLRNKHQQRFAWKDYSKWEGREIKDDIPYEDLPWEIEAFTQEKILTHEYLKSFCPV